MAYRVTYLFRRQACSRGVYPMLSCCFAFLVGVGAAAWCSWRLFVQLRVRLLLYTLLCLRRLTRRVRAWAYLVAAWCPRALLRVFHDVVCSSLFFRVAVCVWGVSPPGGFHTPCLSHGVLVICVSDMIVGVLSCWWWRGRCALSLMRCAPRLPFFVRQRGVSCNILVSAAGMFSWHLPYVVLLFCFSCWC